MSPQWGPGTKPLEAEKICTYSFSFEVLEIQINTPMTLPSQLANNISTDYAKIMPENFSKSYVRKAILLDLSQKGKVIMPDI